MPCGSYTCTSAPASASAAATASEGASRTSSGVGLEGAHEHGDRVPERSGTRRTAAPPTQPYHLAAAALVDQVDLVQEAQRLAGAQLLGPGLERADVLGQAAAAETDPACRNRLPIRGS
jgi:hypothetical protein